MRAVRMARDAGALSVLPLALIYRAALHVHAGEFDRSLGPDRRVRRDRRGDRHCAPAVRVADVRRLARRGARTSQLFRGRDPGRERPGRGTSHRAGATTSTAVLYNGLGRYQDALRPAQRACEYEDLGSFGWSLSRSRRGGRPRRRHEVATAALRRLEERTSAIDSDWALGIGPGRARC